jgi:hypothetical protein
MLIMVLLSHKNHNRESLKHVCVLNLRHAMLGLSLTRNVLDDAFMNKRKLDSSQKDEITAENLTMNLLEPKECWLPNKLFVSMYLTSLSSLALLAIPGVVTRQLSESAFSLAIVLLIMGGLSFMKSISIIRCPSKVLVTSMVFMGVTSFLGATYF